MPRRPEIGNVQLYPNRPLRKSDRNGYVLKFYCPIRRKRIRRNCGTRDRREARRILRECRERLLNGEYVASDGAISAGHESPSQPERPASETKLDGETWQVCFDRYTKQLARKQLRAKSITDAVSRINIAERIFEGYREDRGLSEGLLVTECMTLDMLEYLQDRLLAGDESHLDSRSPNTVNSMMAAIMAFARFCARRAWIESIPAVDQLDVDEVMRGRPITGEELERMLKVCPKVVGPASASSWKFALRVIWESGFRVGDLVDFSWDDERHIHPVWPTRKSHHPTVVIPSSQKNRRVQEIPMLTGLEELLSTVPKSQRTGWIVDPQPIQYEVRSQSGYFRPTDDDLRQLVADFSNCSIAEACNVSERTVRKWLDSSGIRRKSEFKHDTGMISSRQIAGIRKRATPQSRTSGTPQF